MFLRMSINILLSPHIVGLMFQGRNCQILQGEDDETRGIKVAIVLDSLEFRVKIVTGRVSTTVLYGCQ